MALKDYISGRLTPFGLMAALAVFLLDQAYKWFMIGHLGFVEGQKTTITAFFDIVLVWNKGISYGLLPQDTAFGRYLLLSIVFATCLILLVWLARATHKSAALGLGLLIGGAAGNALDRIVHGAVADFFSLHAFGFYWYVFNLADVAIVAGVALLLYDSVRADRQT